jgi:hemerythrin
MQTRAPIIPSPEESDGGWEMIIWTDEYLTGNPGMDGDHRRLLALFNEFLTAVNAGQGDGAVRGVLDELTDYTRHHFAREERLMLEGRYPQYERHKKMHDTFSRQVADARDHLVVGSGMSAFLLSFLGGWLARHILGTDRDLGHFLSNRGAADH